MTPKAVEGRIKRAAVAAKAGTGPEFSAALQVAEEALAALKEEYPGHPKVGLYASRIANLRKLESAT